MKKKKKNTSHFGAQNVQWRRVSNSRERSSNFSLDFLAFEPLDRVGPRSKVFYAERATRGHMFWGVSKTPRGRGLLLLGYFRF